MRPKCFNNEQEWLLWREMATLHPPVGFGYCSDCQPSYQSQMLQEKRCEHPEVYFTVYHGDYIGESTLNKGNKK